MWKPREIGGECSTGSREQQVQGYLLFHRYFTAAKKLREAGTLSHKSFSDGLERTSQEGC